MPIPSPHPGAFHTDRVWYFGHSTLAIDLAGVRVLTDPVLRGRIAVLARRGPVPRGALEVGVDAVLISHVHRDHLDVPSLRLLGPSVRLLVPRGAGSFLAERGFADVSELEVGDVATVGQVTVRAAPARHEGFRPPFGPRAACLGFVLEAGARVYFAGDTDIFAGMRYLAPIDVALLPVWGWGPSLGPGHLNPRSAAKALQLIRPTVAVPIHWGTFAPFGMERLAMRFLTRPPKDFATFAQRAAPDVTVRILEPGGHLDLASVLSSAASR